MRPVALTMTAFGPYARQEDIDFTKLGDKRFFLITGPTGSGKTTILDAITFALYGTASGDLRDNRSLRSDYATPETKTEVRFTFTNLGKTYEITRTPEQVLKKQRGEGTRTVPVGASLVEITDSGERNVLATSNSTATRTIENLLGFQARQFRQLMVLPQGEFRRFLVADSKERKQILETLFKTEQYSSIEEALDARARTLHKQYDETKNRYEVQRETVGAENATDLKLQLEQQKSVLKEREAQEKQAREQAQKAVAEYEAARQIARNLDTWEACAARQQKLQAEGPEIQQLEEKLKVLEEAQNLHPVYKSTLNAKKQNDTALEQLNSAQTTFEKAQKDYEIQLQSAADTNTDALQQQADKLREDMVRMATASAETVRLAQELEAGKPCPVCGSLDHPHPATQTKEQQDKLEQETKKVEKQLAAIKKQQKQLEKARGVLDRAKGSLETAKKGVASAQKAFEEEKAVYAKALEASPFPDQQAFLGAHKALSLKSGWQKKVEQYKGQCSSLQGEMKVLAEQIQGKERPDLEPLAQAQKQAQDSARALASETGALKESLERGKRVLASLEKLEKELDQLQKAYGPIGQLAETAKGNNDRKLTFSSFVLQAVLDDVLQTANLRLNKISQGRYSLYRSENIVDARKEQGLGLEIMDAFTGQARAVTTLSGGEIFFTSLSLALGLSDVLESYAGGLHLDTILVDEGFGSLDPETLDSAINALLELQQGGRLVGIISHVAELKERISAQLEIIPTQQGSTTRFRV